MLVGMSSHCSFRWLVSLELAFLWATLCAPAVWLVAACGVLLLWSLGLQSLSASEFVILFSAWLVRLWRAELGHDGTHCNSVRSAVLQSLFLFLVLL